MDLIDGRLPGMIAVRPVAGAPGAYGQRDTARCGNHAEKG